MPRASRVCSVPGCGTLTQGGRCDQHTRQADRARGTAHQRGYNGDHLQFRADVLRRDPACVLCHALATVADHWPLSRRELQAAGADPNNPAHGRGLCKHHHDQHTARTTPGGWHTPTT